MQQAKSVAANAHHIEHEAQFIEANGESRFGSAHRKPCASGHVERPTSLDSAM